MPAKPLRGLDNQGRQPEAIRPRPGWDPVDAERETLRVIAWTFGLSVALVAAIAAASIFI